MIYAVSRKTKEHLICGNIVELPDGQWYFVEADADGWIEWSGGECPLPDNQRCDVKDQSGEVFDFTRAENIGDSNWRKNITHYRPILDDKPQAPDWDGEGLPPVGAVCESALEGAGYRAGWLTYSSAKIEVWKDSETHDEVATRPGDRSFRPIRTDRERWIDQAADVALQSGDALGNIYDALKSGELPQP